MHVAYIREPAFWRYHYDRCFRVRGQRSLREVPYLRCQPECSTGHSLKDCRRAGIRIGACQFFRSRDCLRDGTACTRHRGAPLAVSRDSQSRRRRSRAQRLVRDRVHSLRPNMQTEEDCRAAFSCECAVTVANAKAHNVPNMCSCSLTSPHLNQHCYSTAFIRIHH